MFVKICQDFKKNLANVDNFISLFKVEKGGAFQMFSWKRDYAINSSSSKFLKIQ